MMLMNPKDSSVTADHPTKVVARDVKVFYGQAEALHGIDLDVGVNQVTALIGPSGCGKSTFLRCLNRMNDVIEGCRIEGHILLDGDDIYSKNGSATCGEGVCQYV